MPMEFMEMNADDFLAIYLLCFLEQKLSISYCMLLKIVIGFATREKIPRMFLRFSFPFQFVFF